MQRFALMLAWVLVLTGCGGESGTRHHVLEPDDADYIHSGHWTYIHNPDAKPAADRDEDVEPEPAPRH